jgi:hypothetical protein
LVVRQIVLNCAVVKTADTRQGRIFAASAYLPSIALTLCNLANFYLRSEPNRDSSIRYAIQAMRILLPIVDTLPDTQSYIQTGAPVLIQGWNLGEQEIQELLDQDEQPE